MKNISRSLALRQHFKSIRLGCTCSGLYHIIITLSPQPTIISIFLKINVIDMKSSLIILATFVALGRACGRQSQECQIASECCDGLKCRSGHCGTPAACRPSGAACGVSAECCSGLICRHAPYTGLSCVSYTSVYTMST